MLLKLWREIEIDLKKPTQSWEAAFEEFLETALAKTKDILSGIHYYHQRPSSAMQQAHESAASNGRVGTDIEPWTEVEKWSNGSIYLKAVLGGRRSDEADLNT